MVFIEAYSTYLISAAHVALATKRILKKLVDEDDQTTNFQWIHDYAQCTEVHFSSFFSDSILVNQPERKLAKRIYMY